MLGSVHDADDALQETFIRAWRGAAGLRERRSARSWLYSIATNVCLTELGRRDKRALPHDFGPAAPDGTPPGVPAAESVWIEPYPDAVSGVPDGKATPEASYEQREALELAFIAALQHLAPNQRAALILREVLGYTAAETAELLRTSVAAVNSALQRARATVSARVPARSQQRTLRLLGDAGLHTLVQRYVEAWERCNVDAFAALLADDASFAMPPLTTWYHPRDAVISWARDYSLNGAWRWKTVLTQANGQPALAFYAWDDAARTHLPFALNVLTVRDGLIGDVTAFIVRATGASEQDAYVRFPERGLDDRTYTGAFARFGLPDHLD